MARRKLTFLPVSPLDRSVTSRRAEVSSLSSNSKNSSTPDASPSSSSCPLSDAPSEICGSRLAAASLGRSREHRLGASACPSTGPVERRAISPLFLGASSLVLPETEGVSEPPGRMSVKTWRSSLLALSNAHEGCMPSNRAAR